MSFSKSIKRLVLSLFIIAACISLIQGLNNAFDPETGSRDFQWEPSRDLLEHTDPYVTYINSGGKSPVFLSQHPVYPASSLMFLWPYAVWEWTTAKVLWTFSNLLFTVVIFFSLFQLLPTNTPRGTKLLIVVLFLMGLSWRNGLGNGQHAIFTLSFFLLAVVLFSQNNRGAAIPFAISWFKYTITFPLSLFFARSKRGWVLILAAAAIHTVLIVFLAVWIHTSPINLLFGHIQVALSATSPGYLDVFTIASRLGLSSKLIPGIVSLVILGVTYAAVRKDSDVLSCLSTLALAAMVAVFHRSYDFVVLIIPLSYALREQASNARAKYYLLIIGMIWFVDKMVFVISDQAWFSSFEFFSTYYFWIKVLVFYGALASDWLFAFKSRPFKPQLASLHSRLEKEN